MGEVELENSRQLYIHSHIITYGHAATPELTEQIRDEIETMWNEPQALITIQSIPLMVRFKITAEFRQHISDIDVYRKY
jgi:hypothetical protein